MASLMTDKQAVRRAKFVPEDLGSHLAPHEQRAASATDDRQLRTSLLAANSGRLMATLEAERDKLGLDEGYQPEVGPTGEKPVVPAAVSLPVAHDDHPSVPVEHRVAPDLVVVEDLPGEAEAPVAARPAPVAKTPLPPEITVPAPVLSVAPPLGEPVANRGTSPTPAPEPEVEASASLIPQLIRELAGLHADGILTDDEFADKKRELLARI